MLPPKAGDHIRSDPQLCRAIRAELRQATDHEYDIRLELLDPSSQRELLRAIREVRYEQ